MALLGSKQALHILIDEGDTDYIGFGFGGSDPLFLPTESLLSKTIEERKAALDSEGFGALLAGGCFGRRDQAVLGDALGITASMSRKGNPFDNAVVESIRDKQIKHASSEFRSNFGRKFSLPSRSSGKMSRPSWS